MPNTTQDEIQWSVSCTGWQSDCGRWTIRAEGSGFRCRHFTRGSDTPDRISGRFATLGSAKEWCEGEQASMRHEL